MTDSSGGFIRVRGGVKLRAGPARETCFTVVSDQAQMHKFPDGSAGHRRELLHSNVNEEIQSLEIAAQTLVDFPEASWDMRLHLARQAWDEVRHARLFMRRLLELGGKKGEFPIINQEWGVVCMFDSLAGRLAVQNRIFEAGSLDVLKESVDVWTDWGDEATAQTMDAVLADEISHVRFANDWLERQKTEDPKALLKAIAAMSDVKSWAKALTPPEMKMEHEIPTNAEARRIAGLAAG